MCRGVTTAQDHNHLQMGMGSLAKCDHNCLYLFVPTKKFFPVVLAIINCTCQMMCTVRADLERNSSQTTMGERGKSF